MLYTCASAISAGWTAVLASLLELNLTYLKLALTHLWCQVLES